MVGQTGSGKTSLLLALLGEMHFDPPNVESWFQLPRDGGVAYCAQEAWLVNDTIKVGVSYLMVPVSFTPLMVKPAFLRATSSSVLNSMRRDINEVRDKPDYER